MATQESSTPVRPPFIAMVLYYGTYLLIFGMIGLTLFLTWPGIVATFQARIAGAPGIVQPTPIINVGGKEQPNARSSYIDPIPAPAPAPRVTPIPGIAQTEAEGLKLYQTTVAAQQRTAPNVDNTGDAEPLTRGSKSSLIEPAAGVVPTQAPLEATPESGIFGSKPAPPLNIQETHQCVNGQVWVEDRGCKNPTPIGGG